MIQTGSYIIVLLFFLASCREETGIPRPRAYPRVEYPKREYREFNKQECPFTFRYPAYAEIKEKEEACWFDLYMPVFEARIHCSYLPLKSREQYDDLVKDAFVIAGKINERANYMEESRIMNSNGIGGLSLKWNGPAASPVHFFLSDSTAHFFKAALYFESKVQPDSLAPIVSFIQRDIDEMISTFSWKE